MNQAFRLLLAGWLVSSAVADEVLPVEGISILSPAPHALLSGPVQVAIDLPDVGEFTWELTSTNLQSGSVSLLASGSGPLAESPVYDGTLAQGVNCIGLSLVQGTRTLESSCNVAVTAPPLADWLLDEGALDSPAQLGWMPEIVPGASMLLRHWQSLLLEQVSAARLSLHDSAGQVLPGWPLELGAIGFSPGRFSTPMPLDPAGSSFLICGDSELLIFSQNGTLLRREFLAASLQGSPSLLPEVDGGWTLLLPVSRQGQSQLLMLADDLHEIHSWALDGGLALDQLLVADFTADGTMDFALSILLGSDLQLKLIDGQSLEMTTLGHFPLSQASGWMAGDVNGDFISDLLLALDDGRLILLDEGGIKWQRDLAVSGLSAPTLVDLDADGLQELLLVADGLDGQVLRALDHEGESLPGLDALLLSESHSLATAVQAFVDASGQSCLLVHLNPQAGSEDGSKLLAINADGSLIADWELSVAIPAAPRLTDVNADGMADLLVVDALGRAIAWPLERSATALPHPRGSIFGDGRSLQPVLNQLPPVIWGKVALACSPTAQPATRWANVELIAGQLDLHSSPLVEGSLRIHATASLLSPAFAAWNGNEQLQLELAGRLLVDGGGEQQEGALPQRLAGIQNLLGQLQLRPEAGSVLELSKCRLDQPLECFELSEGRRLVLNNCWIEPSMGGILLEAANLEIKNSLVEMGAGFHLGAGSSALIQGSILTSADSIGIQVEAANLQLDRSLMLTCETGLLLKAGSAVLLDSVHFQGNGIDLRVQEGATSPVIHHCDFVESHEAAIVNEMHESVLARFCHWDVRVPAIGPVDRSDPQVAPFQLPVVPQPVFDVETGPLVFGDEPLEWSPVEFSVGGIPIDVHYRIYRSSDPYNVVRPENLVAITEQTWYLMRSRGESAFYAVTACIGDPVTQ